jgi:hypothetical protein
VLDLTSYIASYSKNMPSYSLAGGLDNHGKTARTKHCVTW